MCKCCQVLTWRMSCALVAVGAILVSFVLGPLQTVFILGDSKLALYEFVAAEPDAAILYGAVGAAAWLVCVSNVVLLVAAVRRSTRLLTLYLALTAVHVVAAPVLAIRYLIQCTAIDPQCLDHAPGRAGDDVGAALGLLVLAAGYVAVWLFVVFIVCNYKLLISGYIGAFYYFMTRCSDAFFPMKSYSFFWSRYNLLSLYT